MISSTQEEVGLTGYGRGRCLSRERLRDRLAEVAPPVLIFVWVACFFFGVWVPVLN